MIDKIKVFYREEQNADGNHSFSPSAGKPKKVVESWVAEKMPIEICDFSPLSRDVISLAHDRRYVDCVLDLTEENGFGNLLEEVARTLPYTNGSMLAASIEAVMTNSCVVSPTSGFHHARYGMGGAFCTFNGLMISAVYLKLHNLVNRVGILDLDAHYGDGTDNIIKTLKIDYIHHYSFCGDFADDKIGRLPRIVEGFNDCDIILYQAGADAHIDDPLGGSLTSEEMRERDRIVFSICKEMGKPVVWNFAGGYQRPIEKVIKIHTDTLLECLKVYGG